MTKRRYSWEAPLTDYEGKPMRSGAFYLDRGTKEISFFEINMGEGRISGPNYSFGIRPENTRKMERITLRDVECREFGSASEKRWYEQRIAELRKKRDKSKK